MQAVLNFLSHYITTYQAYLASPVIWQAFVVYLAVIFTSIFVMVKMNKLQYFLHILFPSIAALSCVTTYTFISLW